MARSTLNASCAHTPKHSTNRRLKFGISAVGQRCNANSKFKHTHTHTHMYVYPTVDSVQTGDITNRGQSPQLVAVA